MRRAARAVRLFGIAAAIAIAACNNASIPSPADSAQDAAIHSAVSEVSTNNLLSILQSIDFDRSANSADLPVVQSTLLSYLSGDGYSITTTNTGSTSTWIPPMINILADKPGNDASAKPIYVTAHWDTVSPSHGMDDNGSGVAALIEVARILSTRTLTHPIRFALFANEETNIDGSWELVASLTDAQLPQCFINFESIGYAPPSADALSILFGQRTGAWIAVCAPDWSAASLTSFEVAARDYAPTLSYLALSAPGDYKQEVLVQAIQLSDNARFWDRGVPGLMISDAPPLRNPNYHTTGDTIASLDLTFMTEVVRASLATICLEAGLKP